MKQSRIFHMLRKPYAIAGLTIAFLAVALMSGCGGGGHDNFGISGTLSSPALVKTWKTEVPAGEVPVVDAVVAVQDTEDHAITDSNGNFTFDTGIPGSSLTFLISKGSLNTSYVLTDIPSNATDVILALSVDLDTGVVTAKSVDFVVSGNEEPSPTAAPTTAPGEPTTEPTAQPTGQPTVQPTGQPTSQPTAAQPTSAPTSAPTSKPTAKPTTPSGGGSAANGQALFNSHCASCHSASSLKGRSASQIKGANMSQGLNDSQLNDVAAYLASV